jgi:hypothetical protein
MQALDCGREAADTVAAASSCLARLGREPGTPRPKPGEAAQAGHAQQMAAISELPIVSAVTPDSTIVTWFHETF